MIQKQRRQGYLSPALSRMDRRERRTARRPSMGSVDFWFVAPSGLVFAAGRVVNASRDGLCFRTLHQPSIGQTIHLSRDSSRSLSYIPARVVHTRKVPGRLPFECGCELLRPRE